MDTIFIDLNRFLGMYIYRNMTKKYVNTGRYIFLAYPYISDSASVLGRCNSRVSKYIKLILIRILISIRKRLFQYLKVSETSMYIRKNSINQVCTYLNFRHLHISHKSSTRLCWDFLNTQIYNEYLCRLLRALKVLGFTHFQY